MLWYKAWLETRWRLLMPLGMILLVLFQSHFKGHLQITAGQTLAVLPIFWLLAPMALAGPGTTTESPFRAVKGVQGSVYFTLALPVSRARLLAMRASFGMMETAAIVLTVCAVAGIAFPEVRQHVSLADGARYIVTVLLCSTAVYGLSTLFASFLEQQWAVAALMATVMFFRWLAGDDTLFFGAMGNSSPLVTHTLPWMPIGISVGIGIVSLLAAAKVVEARQY